jgi:ABC-type bacteriocin/lantibiotic exporter with double-glycine peptidase domain
MTVGGLQVAAGTMSLGDLLAFFAVLTLLRARISSAFVALPQVIAGLQSLRRLEELLATDAPEPYSGTARARFAGAVRLEEVEFAYGAREILRGASLEIAPHETVALVGPNGAGKSTIVSLVLGLYRPDAGRLLADGRPYDDLELDDVRRGIGVVLQDPLIFHGTIRENIAFGLPDATDAAIEEAAGWATAASFVRALPAGFETDVGAEGVRLSAGQRQRIAIARALLVRPALVVLDEPATYLDAGATAALVGNLTALPWHPALLLIGHDELLLPRVDRVYRLEDGVTEPVRAAEAVGA